MNVIYNWLLLPLSWQEVGLVLAPGSTMNSVILHEWSVLPRQICSRLCYINVHECIYLSCAAVCSISETTCVSLAPVYTRVVIAEDKCSLCPLCSRPRHQMCWFSKWKIKIVYQRFASHDRHAEWMQQLSDISNSPPPPTALSDYKNPRLGCCSYRLLSDKFSIQ